jgi:hypothetical protein
MDKKSKITIDFSEFNKSDYCELECKFANMTIRFPSVWVKELECSYDNHVNELRDGVGYLITKQSSNLIDSISGKYEFIPCINKENDVQYIIEVKA